jgi:hypothetical protein
MSQSSLARWSVGIAALILGLVTNAASLSEAREFRFQPDPEEPGVASPSDIRPAQSRSAPPAVIQKAPQQQIQSYKQVQVPVQAPIQKGNCCVPSCIRYFRTRTSSPLLWSHLSNNTNLLRPLQRLHGLHSRMHSSLLRRTGPDCRTTRSVRSIRGRFPLVLRLHGEGGYGSMWGCCRAPIHPIRCYAAALRRSRNPSGAARTVWQAGSNDRKRTAAAAKIGNPSKRSPLAPAVATTGRPIRTPTLA